MIFPHQTSIGCGLVFFPEKSLRCSAHRLGEEAGRGIGGESWREILKFPLSGLYRISGWAMGYPAWSTRAVCELEAMAQSKEWKFTQLHSMVIINSYVTNSGNLPPENGGSFHSFLYVFDRLSPMGHAGHAGQEPIKIGGTDSIYF